MLSANVARIRDAIVEPGQGAIVVVFHHLEPEYQYFKGKRRSGPVEQRVAQRIGRRLKDLRGRLGVTAGELAARSGIHRPNISRLEGGKHTPNLETLERLANALGGPVVELVG